MKQQLLKRLEPAGQEHLLAFWDELDEPGRNKLSGQILELDLQLVTRLIRQEADEPLRGGSQQAWAELAARAMPPPAFRLDGSGPKFSADQARRRGQAALRAGKLGVILVAGGQGTRLDFQHPKGMFPFGPVSGRTLYQIVLEQLLAVGRRYGVRIPLYLMTSPATHEETLQFLCKHRRFGLPEEDVRLFCQAALPAVDADGRILLAAKDTLLLSPDGHGGMLAAWSKSGCLDEACRRGVEHLFYGQIDNPLIQLCDPLLIGYHLLSQSEMTAQVVAKTGPRENVGTVVAVDGRLRIIEYTDLPEEVAQQRNEDGSLKLWAGNIAVHVFALPFLRRMLDRPDVLPLHRATKEVRCIGRAGPEIRLAKSKATKFERFIFDLLPHARHAIAVEADRACAFAPVKNANRKKVDTPAIAQAMMIEQHTRWLRQAGAVVEAGVAVEISPLFALDADELARKIPPGLVVREDRFFGPTENTR